MTVWAAVALVIFMAFVASLIGTFIGAIGHSRGFRLADAALVLFLVLVVLILLGLPAALGTWLVMQL